MIAGYTTKRGWARCSSQLRGLMGLVMVCTAEKEVPKLPAGSVLPVSWERAGAMGLEQGKDE